MWVICRSAVALAPYFLLAIRAPRGPGDSRAISELFQLGQLLRLAKKGNRRRLSIDLYRLAALRC
jgi:hypothetical protein